jgi:hypothetical protein
MTINLHIAPVGFGPLNNRLILESFRMVFFLNLKMHFVPGPKPIPALSGSAAPGLGLPSTRSYDYGSQSSPASSRCCPAPSSGKLVQYAG